MKILYRITILLSLFFLIFTKGYGQIDAIGDKSYRLDTLRTNSLFYNVNVLFSISGNENNKYTNFKFANSARINYILRKADIDLSFRQMLERADDRTFNYKHYMMLSSGIFKYKPIDSYKTEFREIYPEPILVFQNNADRGLYWRFQIGALFHPWGIIKPKLKMNIGLGVVHDWSSWEVNDRNVIDNLPEKVLNSLIRCGWS